MARGLQEIAYTSGASQDGWELHRLLMLMDEMNACDYILEIGVDQGYLMQTWQEAFCPPFLRGIDISMERFDRNTGLAKQVYVGDSADPSIKARLVEELGDAKLDMLFIDGDHLLDPTLRDYDNFKDLVRPGGLICLHDISRIPGVFFADWIQTRPAFDHLKKFHPSLEISNGPLGDGAPGIGVLFV